jgi:hypothetical protein
MEENKLEKKGIYLEPEMENLPEYYDRDIIKVLTKNPKEVMVLWGISLSSYQKIKDFFQCDESQIHYKLYVRYYGEDKNTYFQKIYLPPYSSSYVIKFLHPVHNLRVEVLSYSDNGQIYSLLHSAHINLPSQKPSLKVHKDWVNQKWVNEGLVDLSTSEVLEIKNFWIEAEQAKSNQELEIHEVVERFDGSSGGHFSSYTVASSWGNR